MSRVYHGNKNLYLDYCTQANAVHKWLATGEGPMIMIQSMKVATRFRFRFKFRVWARVRVRIRVRITHKGFELRV